jgi:hypothetical protein
MTDTKNCYGEWIETALWIRKSSIANLTMRSMTIPFVPCAIIIIFKTPIQAIGG